ncbi:MAG: CaiB/BaiF CoA-transferase family protein [Acidimicrobiia bacterium]|nr:CaiB/BaiF CoA-transferase family protein [Acidimicrobiia bacterium]
MNAATPSPGPSNRPLHGLRILDLSRVFAGPVAGRAFSDLGADVVKVEPPDGDITRMWGRKVAGLSTYFTQQNCGKRNVCIDLQQEEGRELVTRLADEADVLLENFRPGVMARFGLDWATLSARNPKLIMLSISGFGQDGPESQRAAYASVIHAESGLVEPREDGPVPLDIDLTVSAADVLSGMHGVIAVMAALRVRDTTGIGQFVDMAMMDAMTFSSDIIVMSLDGYRASASVKGEVWPTAAGQMMITGGLRWIWHQLSTTHGLHDPTPKDAEITDKIASRTAIITDYLCALPDRESVIDALEEANLAWAELRRGRDVIESPTLQARGSVVEIDDRAGGTREVIGSPYRMSVSDTSDPGVAAHRGEHNHEVLAEWLGCERSEVESLAARDVLQTDEWADAAFAAADGQPP